MIHEFDSTITLNDHHLAATGLSDRRADAVEAVRVAVEWMNGAGWIDVEAQSNPPSCHGWVIVYPRGHSITPETAEWRALRHRVEAVAMAAMTAAGTPF
jgi:hypothetical protein